MAVMRSNDQQSSYTAGMQTGTELTTSHARTGDTNDQFFERPVKIAEIEWKVGAALFELLDPWTIFFEDPRNINRLAHFKNLRANLHVYAVVNGNPFYYGRSLMTYQPLPESDGYTFFREGNAADLVEATQRPHIYIDPTKCEGGEIICPFLFPKTYIDIPSREWRKMGNITVASMNALNHANGSTQSIFITVFAYASDVELYTPTSRKPELIAQSNEYGVLSGPSHKIANIARTLANVPTIGPFARATEMIASGVGAMASAFGYSRPPNVNVSSNVLVPPALAITNAADSTQSLALDVKKEVTIDPRTMGLSGDDELALVPMAKREAWIEQFPWAITDPSDYHLFSIRISPTQAVVEYPVPNRHITPSTFAALPFNYWKGSMNVRLQVICSAYHRGRLRVVWDPDFSTAGSVYNVNYSTLIDITESQDMTFKIGWGQNTDYLVVQDLEEASLNFDRIPFTSSDDKCNGTLSVFVVNPLTTPSEMDAPISVNVFTSMDDDFEVTCPRDLPMRFYTPVQNLTPIDPPDPETPETVGQVVLRRVNAGAVLSVIPGSPVSGTSYAHRDPPDPGSLLIGSVTGGRDHRLPVWGPSGGGSYPFTFEFSNTDPTARDISVSIGGNIVVGALPGNIGSATTITVNSVSVPQGFSFITVRFEISSGPAIEMNKVTLPMYSQMAIGYVPPSVILSELNDYDATVADGGFTSAAGPLATTASFSVPSDAYPGAPVTFPAVAGFVSGADTYSHSIGELGFNVSVIPTGNLVESDTNGSPGWRSTVGGYYYIKDLLEAEAFVAESGDTPEDRNDDSPDANAPEHEQAHESMGPTSAIEHLNEVYFGESITSFRTCLKRYDHYRAIGCASNAYGNTQTLPMYPISSQTFTEGPNISFSSDTLWKYVSSAFVCARGGMRYKMHVSHNANPQNINLSVTRVLGTDLSTLQFSDINSSLLQVRGGWQGTAYYTSQIQGFLEFECPWYSQYRFHPSRSLTHYQPSEYVVLDGYRITQTTQNATSRRWYGELYCATAEDFTLAGFLCTPLLRIK